MFGPHPPRPNQTHPYMPYPNRPQMHPTISGRQPQHVPPWGMQGKPQPFPTNQHAPQLGPMQGINTPMAPKKPSIFKSAFTSESGKFDVGKTVQTVDQVVKTVNQVSPLVKQVGSFFIKK